MTGMTFTATQEAALNLEKSIGVTASAGTGKTFLLKNRFIRLLESGVKPGDILCLTFTDKAAAEMRDKIEEEIREQAKAHIIAACEAGTSREEAEDNPLSKALDEIHHCTISTFHGFCSGLLREFPMEADVPVSYSVMDDLATHKLVTSTITEVLQHPRKDQQEAADFLSLHIKSSNAIVSGIKLMYEKWDDFAEWRTDLLSNPEKIHEEWTAQYEQYVSAIWEDFLADEDIKTFVYIDNPKGKNVEEFRSAYEAVVAANTLEERLISLKELAYTRAPQSKALYGDLGSYCTQRKNQLKDLLGKCEVYSFEDEHTEFMIDLLRAFIDLAAYVHDRVRRKMADGGYLNFDDLIRSVRQLLETKPAIRTELYKRYRYILVDEVQDNTPLLTHIVEILAGDIAAENKLFVVGDMKQSIYRFNGADPARVRELLAKFPDDPVELDRNFRTVSPLIADINELFTRVYDIGNPDGISYSGVDADRTTEEGTLTVLESSGKKQSDDGKVLPDEGDLLASWIRHAVESGTVKVQDTGSEKRGWIPATYGDIAILVATHSDGQKIAASLKKYHIPFHVYKGRDYYKEPEVADILNVIRASVFHGDDISLYGALISPYFGISDEQLAVAVASSREPRKSSLWDRLKNTDDSRIQEALTTLETFREWSCSETLSAFVRRIVRECGILSVYAALEGGPDKIRHLKKFVEIADSQSFGGSLGVISFIHTIETCISQSLGSDELGGAEPDMASDDAVNIMTIHASKGLEFKIVALYRMGEPYREKKTASNLFFDPALGFVYLGSHYHGEETDPFELLRQIMIAADKPELLAEKRRIFYVAMTRARDHLVLTTKQVPGENSHMELLKRVAPDLIGTPVTECLCDPGDACSISVDIPGGWVPHLAIEIEPATPLDPDVERALRYGSCMHEIFEGKHIEDVCGKYGLMQYTDQFAEIVTTFRNHPFLKNVAKEWHELSFTNANGEIRRADMVVRYEDGTYRIIDFKTDNFRAIPDERRKQYHEQLTEYSDCLSKIFHIEKPIPACFYATRDGVFIDLEDITTYKPQ